MVVRLARPDVAGTVLLTVSWFQAVCRSRSACSLGAGGGLALQAGRRAPSAAHPLAGAARNSSGGCREQHKVCCSWWSFPGLVCVVADGAAATGRLPLLVAESFVLPTKFSGTMYKAANWECVGRSYARASGRYTDRGGEGSLRVSAASRCRLRDRSPLPVAWESAGAAGRRRSCARFISGAFRRAQGHRLGAVRDFAGLRTGTVRLRRRTTTQKELEQHGRTGTSRSPPCTGCCRTPTRDGSRMRRAAAGRQRGRRQAHRRGSLRDSLAGRYSILNYHDGEIAAVHAATALAVCSPSTRSTPPARLIIETHRAD